MVFCIGMAKTGTQTLAGIWQQGVKAGHEPESNQIIRLIRNKYLHNFTDDTALKLVEEHIIRTDLQIHSSQLNYFILDELLQLFPEGKFILTIREPAEWLDSLINHQLTRKCNAEWQWLRDFRFRPDLYQHPLDEQILSELGLYTLEGYFRYWNDHNSKVIQKVPSEQLLIVRTDQINDLLPAIARFVNSRDLTDNMQASHMNVSRGRLNILKRLNEHYLHNKIEQYCGNAFYQFFRNTTH